MNILDLIFPPKCEICEKLGDYICDDCYNKLKKYELDNNMKGQFFIYRYEDHIRKFLLDYKFNDKAYLSNLFEKTIIKNKKACQFLKSYDIITPVPLHKKRKLERGYNQTELIARKLVKELELQNKKEQDKVYIKLKENVLIKTKNTKPQSTKKLEQRVNDIKGAYTVNKKENIKEKRVLVFDDIYTTGSTYGECRKALYLAGAAKVGVLTIARDFMKF